MPLAHIAGVPVEEMLSMMSPVAFGGLVAGGAGLFSKARKWRIFGQTEKTERTKR